MLNRKVNVRIASLDPNAPRANKDCRVCNRRRIKCDRLLPGCKKCEIRNLQCPGYHLALKWGQGVASRGKLTGRSTPILESTNSQQGLTHNFTLGDSNITSGTPRFVDQISFDSTEDECSTSESISTDDEVDGASEFSDSMELVFQKPNTKPYDFGIDMALSWASLPTILQDPRMMRFINHYDHSLVPTLVWVDSPDNPWRDTILPLAIQSPALLSSILALSSAHLLQRMETNPSSLSWTSSNDLHMSLGFRNKSLQRLARFLQEERFIDTNLLEHSSQGFANSMLATMVVLCHLEMIKSDSDVWRLHLRAARAMLKKRLAETTIDLTDSTSLFLLNEVFLLDVFSSVSTFEDDDDSSAAYPLHEGSGIFGEYLGVIRDITSAERRKESGINLDIVDITQRFENARHSTRLLCKDLNLMNQRMHIILEQFVDIYHYAGLIYAYQALIEPELAKLTIERLAIQLMNALKLVPPRGIFAQNLAWPLFVAGTTAIDKFEDQEWVESVLHETMQSTGFLNGEQGLRFLKVLWNSSHQGSWIDFARAYTKRGNTFLIL